MPDAQQAPTDLRKMYRTIAGDHFPPGMEITFIGEDGQRQTLFYEKHGWDIPGEGVKGLRYGDNPGQEAALYRLVNGNLVLGDVQSIQPGRWLASDIQLLQSGKHPGKTNVTDADSALGILKYLPGATPACVILKHNNPCGAAYSATLADAYQKANMADRIAAFGGTIALNQEVDLETAQLITRNYSEVVVAPEFATGVMDVLAKMKNLRVMKIANMSRLSDFSGIRFPEFHSLNDGGHIVQWSFVPQTITLEQIKALPLGYQDLRTRTKLPEGYPYAQGRLHQVTTKPTEQQYKDLLFGWLVESGVISNSILYVKDGVTVAIGAGGQDRFGMAQFARDKAYRNLADRISWERYKAPYVNITAEDFRREIDNEVEAQHGGLVRACMVSDAFFPFRDGIDVGLNEGVKAVIQPGGSERDFEVVDACNEKGAAMVFTGQRSFKH